MAFETVFDLVCTRLRSLRLRIDPFMLLLPCRLVEDCGAPVRKRKKGTAAAIGNWVVGCSNSQRMVLRDWPLLQALISSDRMSLLYNFELKSDCFSGAGGKVIFPYDFPEKLLDITFFQTEKGVGVLYKRWGVFGILQKFPKKIFQHLEM